MRAIKTSWIESGTEISSSGPASSTRPSTTRSAPCSTSDLVTSSTKKGLPSALRPISRRSGRGRDSDSSSAPAISDICWAESGCSASRTW